MKENLIVRREGHLFYTIALSFVAAVGGLLFGFDTGVISGAISFVTLHFQLSAHQTGFAVSNLMIACTIGALIAGPLTDRVGRKKILILAAFFFAISALLSAIPRTFLELIFARFIGGLAVGIASVLSPMYITEISPAKIRGRLVALNQLAIVVGILISYFSNYLLVNTGPNNWRWMFGVEIIPALFFTIVLFLIPESPRWLMKQGSIEKSRQILAKIGGEAHAKVEIEEIKASLTKDQGSYKDLFKPGLRKVLLIGVLLALFAHITGIDTIIYYGPTIFMKAGFQSNASAIFGSVLIGLINLIFTFVGIALVDKVGRKSLLLIGLTGMGISMVLVGLASNSAQFVVIPVLTFIASFAMSIGVVIWVYLAEIFPTNLRGRAMSIATFVLWISNVLITQIFPWMLETMKQYTFYVLAGTCVIALFFTKTMVFETKNKSLEELEQYWRSN